MKKKYITPYADFIYVDPEDCCGLTLSENASADAVAPGRGTPEHPEAGTDPGDGTDPTEGLGDAKGISWFNDSDSDW